MIEQFKQSVATMLGLKEQLIFDQRLSLAKVLAMSPTAVNSIDLVEVFAATIAKYNLDGLIGIPAFTLDYSIDDVIEVIEGQLRHIRVTGI